jgi:hypothetical protein
LLLLLLLLLLLVPSPGCTRQAIKDHKASP